ncbi:MAG: hypothetical protein WC082_12340 [Victivallales bacterium]
MEKSLKIQVFNSLEEENKAEYSRRKAMTPEQRMREFALLQERVFGKAWTSEKIKKIVSYELLNW